MCNNAALPCRLGCRLGIALALLVGRPAQAGGKPGEEAGERAANLLRVASLLLKDGHLERAAATLAAVDLGTKGLDRARYHSLSGLCALRLGRHAQAVAQLEAATRAGQKEPSAYLLLAQARFGLGNHRGTLEALERTGILANLYPGVFALKAQCHWRSGRKVDAWVALRDGLRRFPEERELSRQQVLLMVDLGLSQQAMTAGLRYLSRAQARADDYLAIAEALRRGKQHRKAILILEQARLRYPRSDGLLRQLARSYLDDRKPFIAAEILARASRRSPELRLEVAELYRRAGRLLSAVYFNEQALEQPAKVRQRLGLLIELQRFEEAAALAPRLSRLGLLADQTIAYALAYALFKTHRFDEAERLLSRLNRPDLFRRGAELRRAMDACRKSAWECI